MSKEEDIIRGLKEGDSRKFKELVDQYQVQVRNICAGIVKDRHEAEDLAQEVFIEVYKSIRNFRGESRLSTWIYRVAVNKSLNYKRKKNRQRWVKPLEDFFTGDKSSDFQDPGSQPSYPLENHQRSQHLYKALDTLPENQRIAFVLNKYDELSYKEISDVMGISLSGVESLIHRAKVNLQKKLWDCFKKDGL
jgi:RNA polymerase sigma-70 factor (ECF subfamily)